MSIVSITSSVISLIIKSCLLCKTRKVKCDRTLPSCGWCTRNSASCEYKERKKPGLRAGYGRELEKRLDKLERILMQQSEVLARLLGQVPNGEQIRWNGIDRVNNLVKGALSERDHETSIAIESNGYASAHTRPDNHNGPYPPGPDHHKFTASLPPISTMSRSHDRRPSLTFMTNATSPPSFCFKPSASSKPLTHGVLKRDATSPDSDRLLTPATATSSSAQSSQHEIDCLARDNALAH